MGASDLVARQSALARIDVNLHTVDAPDAPSDGGRLPVQRPRSALLAACDKQPSTVDQGLKSVEQARHQHALGNREAG
jgi:hypothetical protein